MCLLVLSVKDIKHTANLQNIKKGFLGDKYYYCFNNKKLIIAIFYDDLIQLFEILKEYDNIF